MVDDGGRAADHAVMRAAVAVGSGERSAILSVLGLVGVASVGLVLVALVGIALARRRPCVRALTGAP